MLDSQIMSMQWELIENQLRAANRELVLEAEIRRTQSKLQKKCEENEKLNTDLRKANSQLSSRCNTPVSSRAFTPELAQAERLMSVICNEEIQYQMSNGGG